MRVAGWFRIWLVLTVLGVPAATLWMTQKQFNTWDDIDKATIHSCVDAEWARPNHPDALECTRQAGAYKTVFEREHTTPFRYWSTGLGVTFLADLVITGLIVFLAAVVRWVVRGFRPADGPRGG